MMTATPDQDTAVGITLDLDGAKTLARRWAFAWAVSQSSPEERAGFMGYLPPLDADELAALLGWVRERMEAEVNRRVEVARQWSAFGMDPWSRDALAEAVGALMDLAEDTAHALCEEAGWPS